MVYSNEEARKLCDQLCRVLLDKGLRVEHRDAMLAERLDNPVVLAALSKGQTAGPYVDPLVGFETRGGNYNDFNLPWADAPDEEKKRLAKGDAIDKKISEFRALKARVPPPRVYHDKSDQNTIVRGACKELCRTSS